MRFLLGTAAGWIVFYGADQVFYGGQVAPAIPWVAKAILAGFGLYI